MRKDNNNKRGNRRISLTIDEIREIVRLEIEAAKHNTRGKDIEYVWFELRNHERLPEGWLSRLQQKREAPKFTLTSMNDRNLHQDLYEDERPDTITPVDNCTRHILNYRFRGENRNKLLKTIEEHLKEFPETATFDFTITGVAIQEISKPNKKCQSIEALRLQNRKILEMYSLLSQQPESLCNDSHRIAQGCPEHRQCPSVSTTSRNDVLKLLSLVKRAEYYKRISKVHSQTSTKETFETKLDCCLCKCLKESLKKDCERLGIELSELSSLHP